MSIRTRNEFLDGNESDIESDDGYDSAEQSRGDIAAHANKRRKVDSGSEASFEDLDDVKDADQGNATLEDGRFKSLTADTALADGGDGEKDDGLTRPDDHERIPSSKAKGTKSALKQVEAAAKAVRKSGVVYISRVPPFMKPQTMRHFLEPHAPKGIGRIFLTPEEHAAHTRRVKNGGNKKKSFSDGWVEFASKGQAKIAAETLNGNIIGGKKGNFYHDDLWNMKYLSGFKWNHLTEQIANENAERAARLREEIRKTRKENKSFVQDIERAKMLEGMELKKAAKRERNGGVPGVGTDRVRRPERDFKQRRAMGQGNGKTEKSSAEASKVLRQIM